MHRSVHLSYGGKISTLTAPQDVRAGEQARSHILDVARGSEHAFSALYDLLEDDVLAVFDRGELSPEPRNRAVTSLWLCVWMHAARIADDPVDVRRAILAMADEIDSFARIESTARA